jgi:hypothetical protein
MWNELYSLTQLQMVVTFHFKLIVKISICDIIMVNTFKNSHFWNENDQN